jgi:23S rRNA (uracil1939-C5)-methyltransferase
VDDREGPERVACEHAAECGGCPLIELGYDEQLAWKRARVVEAIARYPGLELTYTEPVVPARPITGYRTRAKLMVGPEGIGLFAKGGGHRVVDGPGCRVLPPLLLRVSAAIRARLADGRIEAAGPRPSVGALRSIDLREVAGAAEARVLLTLVVHSPGPLPEDVGRALEATARELVAEHPEICGVAVNLHDGAAPQVLGPETRLLAGEGRAADRVGASTVLASHGAFVQAHRAQAATIHERLAALFRPQGGARPRVLDLYGGSGAIALALAEAGCDVTLVESFGPAVEAAKESARRQGLSLACRTGDAATVLRELAAERRPWDGVVVNPPRRGLAPEARELVARLGAPTVAYVSCDPQTLARDLDHLARLGFTAPKVEPLDMIPLTEEVETLAVLRRASPAAPRVLYEEDTLLAVEKGAHEPTTPQGEYVGSLLDRVRGLSGADRAVPVYRLDVGTSGVVLFARTPELVGAWQTALSAGARKVYLAGARGVAPQKGAVTRELREGGRVQPARTRYRRLAIAGGHSVLRVIPEEGRAHQVRRHLAMVGHAVLGDARYGHAPTNRFFEEKHGLDRTFLHCVRLEVDHPQRHGVRLVVESPVPGDLRAVLDRVGAGDDALRFLDQKAALGEGGSSSLPSAHPPKPGRR